MFEFWLTIERHLFQWFSYFNEMNDTEWLVVDIYVPVPLSIEADKYCKAQLVKSAMKHCGLNYQNWL
jgi:hypothetical protein